MRSIEIFKIFFFWEGILNFARLGIEAIATLVIDVTSSRETIERERDFCYFLGRFFPFFIFLNDYTGNFKFFGLLHYVSVIYLIDMGYITLDELGS